MDLFEPAHLLVLLGDELLVHRGDFDVEVVFGKVEVRGEETGGVALIVEFDGEGSRFVFPGDPVEVEEEGELPLTVVSEVDFVGG
ncbi:MAG: hypothetical protein ACE5F5_07040 [Acidimicrobiia bacterium]